MGKSHGGGRRRGGQAQNRNALKHGFYARAFDAQEAADLKAADVEGLDAEIALMRVAARRALAMLDEVRSVERRTRLIEVIGEASTRIATLYRTRQFIEGRSGGLDEAFDQALREVVEEKFGPA